MPQSQSVVLETSPSPSAIRFINPFMSSGAEIRRLQAASGETPCFGTDARYQCKRDDCRLARRCLGGLVAHWKR